MHTKGCCKGRWCGCFHFYRRRISCPVEQEHPLSRTRRSLRGTGWLLSPAIPPLLAGIAVGVWDEAVPFSIGLTRVRARRTTEVRTILLHAHYSPRSSQGAFADRLQTGTATQRRGTERGAVWLLVIVSTSQRWREFFSILNAFLSDFPRVSDANCHIRRELPARGELPVVPRQRRFYSSTSSHTNTFSLILVRLSLSSGDVLFPVPELRLRRSHLSSRDRMMLLLPILTSNAQTTSGTCA